MRVFLSFAAATFLLPFLQSGAAYAQSTDSTQLSPSIRVYSGCEREGLNALADAEKADDVSDRDSATKGYREAIGHFDDCDSIADVPAATKADVAVWRVEARERLFDEFKHNGDTDGAKTQLSRALNDLFTICDNYDSLGVGRQGNARLALIGFNLQAPLFGMQPSEYLNKECHLSGS